MRYPQFIVIAFVAFLAACSGKLSTDENSPAHQLAGHWVSPGNDHLYFGKFDPSSRKGSYLLIHPDGKAFPHQYRVESEDLRKRTVKITMLFVGGDSRETTYTVADDGKSAESTTVITGIDVNSGLKKVDDKTAP
jgi:hypothetical protein